MYLIRSKQLGELPPLCIFKHSWLSSNYIDNGSDTRYKLTKSSTFASFMFLDIFDCKKINIERVNQYKHDKIDNNNIIHRYHEHEDVIFLHISKWWYDTFLVISRIICFDKPTTRLISAKLVPLSSVYRGFIVCCLYYCGLPTGNWV